MKYKVGIKINRLFIIINYLTNYMNFYWYSINFFVFIGSSSYPLSSVNDGTSGQLDCQGKNLINWLTLIGKFTPRIHQSIFYKLIVKWMPSK